MPALIIYLIKANVALTLFYLAYRFGLRRLTFYALNRYFLLIGIAFSATFPLVDVAAFFQQHEQLAGSVTYYAMDWNSLQQYMTQQDPFTIWNLLQYVFWAGVAVMAIRFIIQLISLLRIHLQATSGRINNEKIKLIPGKINPFSFFKNIYINPSLHSSEELKTILAHENIHIREWHTLDVLAGEINNIFYWFNPGAWLMKNAIRENLEFITDRKLLQSGINAKSYQYSLLKTVGAFHNTPLANNFNFSHLKQRIRMMNKKRSSGFHLFRYLLLLPVIAVVALVVTSSRGQEIKSKKNGSIVNLQRQEKDTVPLSENSKLSADSKDFYKRNPSVKSLSWSIMPNEKGHGVSGYAKKNGKMEITKGKVGAVWVSLKNGKIEKYHFDNPYEMKKAETKYGKFPAPPVLLPPATLPQSKPKVKYTPPKVVEDTALRNALYIVNGKIIDKKDLKQKHIDFREIDSISILKGKSAKEKYGEKAKNGAIEYFIDKDKKSVRPKIHFTPPEVIKDTEISDTISQNREDNYYAHLAYQSAKEKDYDKAEIFAQKSLKINPDNSTAKQVLNYVKQVEDYQEKMKEYKQKKKLNPSDTAKVKVQLVPNYNGLYVIDGKIKSSNEISPNKFRYVSVLKGKSAIEKYGEKGKNGVIEVYTKDFIKKHPEQFQKDTIPSGKIRHSDPSAITAESKSEIIINDRQPKNDPIYIIDNKIEDSNYLKQHLISPSDIQSISVLKDKKAIEKYGEKAKGGVIKIYTKEFVKKHPEQFHKDTTLDLNKLIGKYKHPVFILNTETTNRKKLLKHVHENGIESISMVVSQKKLQHFGFDHADVAIFVETKDYRGKYHLMPRLPWSKTKIDDHIYWDSSLKNAAVMVDYKLIKGPNALKSIPPESIAYIEIEPKKSSSQKDTIWINTKKGLNRSF